ncbi:hypothetical protein [Cohnella cholangitidis]|uniref:N-acetyltransferase domain-containing protein n=1 Tax=Cohnella cholangitidis TaxID=2598458 RepID=A0A7G5C4D7_9BACL|nr:hypothetical protein [Cohnella cholangitidis]QMV44071.1 hypothetical protein FPL14_25060 [Cohnella cholangitidis]
MITWKNAESEIDREEGIQFLCRHGTDLGLLYNWSTVMNSLHYSMEDNGFLIGTDGDDRVAAVLAHTVGTLEDGYKDRARIEIHLVHIEERWRGGATLLSMLRMFARKLLESTGEVREVVFFAPSTDANRRRFGKLATLTKTTEPPCGTLDFYTVSMDRLLKFDASL